MLVSSLRRACSVRASSLEALEDRRLLTEVGGTLASDTVWSVNGSPYEVVRDIVIPEGVKLTIAPGARLRFSPNTGIQVQGGQLLADGSPWQRIIFEPATANAWDGLRFSESLADNRISFADMIRGDGQGEAIQVTESRLHLDNIEWSGTNGTILELEHPSLIVRNSHFPQSSSGEVIHGTYIEGSEYLIIDGNVFEKSDSGDDVIDILGADRPGPVMQILNNVFKGGGDDGLDLDGTDAHVEGNLFMNFQKNTGRATTSNAIATGLPQSGEDNRTQVTIVRNIFVDNDHAILLKEDAFATIENNVFVGMREAVIQFNEVGGTSVRGPGKGAALDGNIFAGNASLFRNLVADDTFRTELTVMHSLIPNESISFGGVQVMTHSLGEGNIEGDPGFVDAANGNYRLLPQSPAIGRGKAGINMGAYVDTMPVITPMEREDLTDNDALFYVAGPSVASYRYRLNDQQYGPLTDATQPIELLDIENDQYSLDVIAMDSAGEWIRQSSPAFGEKIAHIIAPSSAWQGEILPAVVRVYDHAGKINSNFSTPAELDTFGLNETALKIKKGVGTLTSTVTAASDFQLAVPNELRLLAAPGGMIDGQEPRFSKRITLLHDGSLTTEHSGMLSGDEMWNAESEHHVTGDLTITPGTTLTIEAGARVVLATQTNVRVEGKLIVNGSDSEPVLFNALVPNQPWGGIRIVDGEANINYTFFTQGGGDTSQEFGHSNSQPVLRADNSRLTCDNCFLIDNVGKGFASTSDSVVSIQNSIISNADTGGEFANSQVTVTNTYVKDIPNDDGIFQDDDNDGFYFSGVHSSGAPSRFVDSFVIDTKDDGLDHNGAELIVERAWIEGTLHEGLASSNKNTATVVDSVFRYTNQGVEAGYGAPDLQIRNSVVVDTNAQADPDSPINAGVRFGDGYDGSNGSYRGHITAEKLVVWNSGDNVRNFDGEIGAAQPGAIDISTSLTNDPDYDNTAGNISGVPVFSESMHLLRGSAGFAADGGIPLGRLITPATIEFEIDSDLPTLRINEVLALPTAEHRPFLEIVNYGDMSVDLSSVRISTDRDGQDFVALGNVVLDPGQRMVTNADTLDLSERSVSLFLLHNSDKGDGVIDHVTFGRQIAGFSIGRDVDAVWALAVPTPDAPNVITPTAAADSVRLNEWSPNGASGDFVELFNPASLPTNVGALQIQSDETTHEFAPLTFLESGEFYFIESSTDVDLNLRDFSGQISLLDGNDAVIDAVLYQVIGSSATQGRLPDGGNSIRLLQTPTPGQPNSAPIEETEIIFQDGVTPDGYAGTDDVWIRGSNPAENFGSLDRLDSDSDSSGDAEWSLIRWDVSAIPADAIIQSAVITLTVNNSSSDPQQIYAMNRDWSESQATWNRPFDGTSWAAPGTAASERSVLVGTMVTNDSVGSHDIQLNTAGIDVLQGWIADPSTNFGVIIIGGNDGVEIRSSEYASASQRPKLAVTYTESVAIRGDFDMSGNVDEADIALLCQALNSNSNDTRFDLTGDGMVSVLDRDAMITDALQTTYGDANLDGVFDSSDFVLVFQRGEYEDAIIGNSDWTDGDWNCDGEFTTTDLVVAFQAGGYVASASRS